MSKPADYDQRVTVIDQHNPRRRRANAKPSLAATELTEGAGAGAGDNGSLVQQVVQAVSDYIRDHALRVGDTLPGEKHFADAMGVSRAVTREAFGALAALRLINIGNGRKPKVSAIDGSIIATSLNHAVTTAQITVAQIWDVRRTIELRTAALAATSRTEAEAAEISALADALASSDGNPEERSRLDIAFHTAIAQASHNALFVQIVSSFHPLMEVAVPMAWRTRTTDQEHRTVFDNHRAVARAIAAGDAQAASAEMDAHFEAAVTDIFQSMSGPRNPASA